jgi:hypothetical protein
MGEKCPTFDTLEKTSVLWLSVICGPRFRARGLQAGSFQQGLHCRVTRIMAVIALVVCLPPCIYAQVINTANITALQTAVTASPGTTQTVPGAGNVGFSSCTTFTITYAGEINSITGLTVGSTTYNPQPFNGPVTTSLFRVTNPAFVGNLANNNSVRNYQCGNLDEGHNRLENRSSIADQVDSAGG